MASRSALEMQCEQRIAGRRAQALVKAHVVLHEGIDVAPGALHPAHGAGQLLDVVGAAFLGRQAGGAHLDGRAQIQGLFGRRLLRRQRVLHQVGQGRTAQGADAGRSPVRDLEDPGAAQRTIRFPHDPATDLQVGAQLHFGRQPLAGGETVRADVVHQVVRHPIGQVAVLRRSRARAFLSWQFERDQAVASHPVIVTATRCEDRYVLLAVAAAIGHGCRVSAGRELGFPDHLSGLARRTRGTGGRWSRR